MELGGFALSLAPDGDIGTVYFDSSGLFSGQQSPLDMASLLGVEHQAEFQQFLAQAYNETHPCGISLALPHRLPPMQLFLTGVKNGDALLLLGVAAHAELSESLFDELTRINNDQANALRSVIKELTQKMAAQTSPQPLDDLTRINNQLIGLQRQLAKQNADLERQFNWMALLNQMNIDLQVCGDLEKTLETITTYTAQLFEKTSGRLYLFRPEIGHFAVRGVWGHPKEGCLQQFPAVEEAILQLIGGTENLAALHAALQEVTPQGCLLLVIPGMEQVVGLLQIELHSRLNPRDLFREQYQSAFLRIIGLAITNIRYQEWLLRDSTIDPLTGLYNRRYFEREIEREISRGLRQRSIFSLVLIDLNQFKPVNDTYGHQVGDELLQRFSQLLKTSVRREDSACRYGGDEFLLLLPEATEEEADLIVQRVIDGCAPVSAAMNHIPLSFAYGIATYPLCGTDREGLIHMADERLYRMKNASR
ncbi:MAG: GGDEF domain-containing protein [Anaerolineae bacterium]|nr:GGDEF domain-containing protein [Anaerolineae bacterium]